ncbi:hypothetical protein [Hymenobacter radiodurans]|uniref:hypothetical protein n=1 Tax=Hymenobacter radiodurans TaxID=2496028 RepID=UPI001F0E4F39|nr:hypothetical protein [Hymenobacter radiodurans]
MWIAVLLLFLTVLGAGLLTRLLPTARTTWMKPLLAFSGAYLFTLTITHLLPEALLLVPNTEMHRIGYYVLGAFLGSYCWKFSRKGLSTATFITIRRMMVRCLFCSCSRW